MIRQAIAMTSMNLQALPQRWGSALVDVFGVACVVAVFVGLFSIAATYREMLLLERGRFDAPRSQIERQRRGRQQSQQGRSGLHRH